MPATSTKRIQFHDLRAGRHWLVVISLAICCLIAPRTSSIASQPEFIRLSHELTWRSAFSPDVTKLLHMHGQLIHVIELSSGKTVLTLKGHQFDVYAAVYSPDGTRILSGDGNSLHLWNAQTGEHIMRLEGRNGNVSCLAITPDGHYAVSGHSWGAGVEFNPPRNLFLWNLRTGFLASDKIYLYRWIPQKLFWFYWQIPWTVRWDFAQPVRYVMEASPCHDDERLIGQEWVNCVAFSPAGNCVSCGRRDGTARLMDLTSGKELFALAGKGGAVQSIAFSPDGRLLIVGAENGDVCLWDLRTKTEVRHFFWVTREMCTASSFLPMETDS